VVRLTNTCASMGGARARVGPGGDNQTGCCDPAGSAFIAPALDTCREIVLAVGLRPNPSVLESAAVRTNDISSSVESGWQTIGEVWNQGDRQRADRTGRRPTRRGSSDRFRRSLPESVRRLALQRSKPPLRGSSRRPEASEIDHPLSGGPAEGMRSSRRKSRTNRQRCWRC